MARVMRTIGYAAIGAAARLLIAVAIRLGS
jgi:hypothetical protein